MNRQINENEIGPKSGCSEKEMNNNDNKKKCKAMFKVKALMQAHAPMDLRGFFFILFIIILLFFYHYANFFFHSLYYIFARITFTAQRGARKRSIVRKISHRDRKR